jgi:Tfp pilus assembly protein PilF
MLRSLTGFLLLMTSSPLFAQQTVQQLRETAISFQRQEDYSNTMMVLSKALELEPNNLTLNKDVAFTYYLGGDFKRAAERILPLTDREDADVQVFQIAGNIYQALEENKTCEKIYKKGLKKFSNSGPLYSEYGELLWEMKRPTEAIAQWEAGINLDPSYSGNYYHAAKFYYAAADKARSLVYGEIFVNLESYSGRTTEIKILLLESYKRIFMANDPKVFYVKPTTAFEKLFLEVMSRQAALAVRGITTDNLLTIRSRFVLDWFNLSAGKFPHQLFDHLQYLMREGMFEAYNQWLFGASADPNSFQWWINSNKEQYGRYVDYQRNKLFRMPANQHYF